MGGEGSAAIAEQSWGPTINRSGFPHLPIMMNSTPERVLGIKNRSDIDSKKLRQCRAMCEISTDVSLKCH
jgi:hypothetical protein